MWRKYQNKLPIFIVSGQDDPVEITVSALVSAPVALLSFCVAALFSDCVVWESPDVALPASCPVLFCTEASAANDVTCVGIIITAAKIIAAILFVILFLFTFFPSLFLRIDPHSHPCKNICIHFIAVCLI